MTASAANSSEFLIASDLRPCDSAWTPALAQMEDVRKACASVLGFDPRVRLVSVPSHPGERFDMELGRDSFVIPAALDFSLWQRETLGQLLAEARRGDPNTVVHHDDVDSGHPLVVDALADQAARALGSTPPQQAGLILVASGHGDPASRAQSYRLMRLLWERLGFARAEVAFVRNAQPFLGHVLERYAREAFPCVLLFQAQWQTEHAEYARVILENFQRAHPEAASNWSFACPPGAHPLLTAWYAQRITALWQQRRLRDAARLASPRQAPPSPALWKLGSGCIARISDRNSLAGALSEVLAAGKPERVLVKVTWHGYATGTYTDPAALDLLLSALPAPAIVLEGHTSSRNLGGAQFDWETEAKDHRGWIRQQEAEFLHRTGLSRVMASHDAQYVNVTEAFWHEGCDGEDQLAFVPSVLRRFRGCPMISFAKFKGPTRLGICNMFGLIPAPLRSAWHGPNITWFARVCCDLAKLYGSLFELCGVVEGLFSATRWNRQGLYRSRWGNYDLIRDAGFIAASRGLVAADILAARLQGQDVNRSAFYDVVRQELGWDSEAAERPLPEGTETIFA